MLAPAGYTDRIASSADFEKDKTGSADVRWRTMKDGVRQTFEHPLGVGLGMNILQNKEEGKGWNGVHNVYLQISTELGIVPAILFIVLLWKLIRGMRRLRSLPESTGGKLALLAEATEGSLVAFAVAAMFHPVAYYFYFYIIAGIAVAVKDRAARLSQALDHPAVAIPISGNLRFSSRQPIRGWRPT
jgi:hypothetical protein